jgi:hypothetical protein
LRDNLSLALRYQRGRRGLYALGMDSIIGYPIIHAVVGSVKKQGEVGGKTDYTPILSFI